MSLMNDSNSMVMPVSPMGATGYGDGFGGGGFFWLLVIFVIAMMNGGWGFGGFGGNGGVMSVDAGVQRGFDQQALMGGLNGISASINSLAQGQCSGFAGVNAAITNAQMANMQSLNQIAMNQQNCCCENRAAVADLKYTVATEACADRAAVSDALNSTLNTINAGIQSIKDQMCQDKIDSKNEQIQNLQNQLYLANLAASQNGQTATIQSGQRALANEIEQYVNPTPVPAYVVQNPNCCTNRFVG